MRGEAAEEEEKVGAGGGGALEEYGRQLVVLEPVKGSIPARPEVGWLTGEAGRGSPPD